MKLVREPMREVPHASPLMLGELLKYKSEDETGRYILHQDSVESSQLARGIVLLNSAGQFGNPSEQPKNNEGQSETALQKLVVYPLKEVI
ncbi:pheophytinase, chloroplastic-like [Canna indica]|uniref:Pheophytinase, chloroplastic-like n=1 Tax=Canna indica TaxID=4628 RepID=A0AAQ3JXK3_9LILI|nr:pheophytinase, chloroplastic-like [Canna indica]